VAIQRTMGTNDISLDDDEQHILLFGISSGKNADSRGGSREYRELGFDTDTPAHESAKIGRATRTCAPGGATQGDETVALRVGPSPR
jgi:hypothetical protein